MKKIANIGLPVILDVVAYMCMLLLNYGTDYINISQNGRYVHLSAFLNFIPVVLLIIAQVQSFRSIDKALGMSMKTPQSRMLFTQGIWGFLLFLPWFIYFILSAIFMYTLR